MLEDSSVLVHVDTDIGGDIDDLCALVMLLRWPGIEIAGITTVVDDEGRRAGYVHRILAMAGRSDIPVAAGEDVASGRFRCTPGYPSDDVYWGQAPSPRPGSIDRAVDLLRRSIQRNAAVVAIGPYTNLARLEERYPGTLATARITLMGGSMPPPRAGLPPLGIEDDWNVQLDIQASEIVLQRGDPTLVTLGAGLETHLRRSYLQSLRRAGPLGNLLAQQAEAFAQDEGFEERWGKTCADVPDDTINFLYDPLACAIAVGWREGIRTERLPLELRQEKGWLRLYVRSKGKPTSVVVGVDGPRFSREWLHIVCGGHAL